MAQQTFNNGETLSSVRSKLNSNATDAENRLSDVLVVVNQTNVASVLGGTIDSSKVYLIDGNIDVGLTSITIPAGGINLVGHTFDTSSLYSTEDNYTMFVSDVGGSGNILGADYAISTSGVNSQVYNLTDATGFSAFEFLRVNYNDCTSLGIIDGYRQGLEEGTGRFGGSPSLTLEGAWAGGYRATTSIVRNMSDSTTEPLFKKGASFTMNSRFLTDMNVDLGTLQPLLDFGSSNFPNAGTLQINGSEITRDGVYNAEDTNITPNISRDDLACYWKANNGLPNTYVGGTSLVVGETTTAVAATATWYDIAGTFTGNDLQHFSASADGKLTHLGTSPREFKIESILNIEGTQNDDIAVRFRKWDDSASTFVDLDFTITARQINNLVGGRDIAIFTLLYGLTLDQNDYVQLQVRNNTSSDDVTLEVGSYTRLQER